MPKPMRSAKRQRDANPLPGSFWMLLAVFLIAIVTPLCDWSCAASSPLAFHAVAAKSRAGERMPSCCHDRGNQKRHHGDEHSSCCPDTTALKADSTSQMAQPLLVAPVTCDVAAVVPAGIVLAPPSLTFRLACDGTRSIRFAPFFSSSPGRAPPVLA